MLYENEPSQIEMCTFHRIGVLEIAVGSLLVHQ